MKRDTRWQLDENEVTVARACVYFREVSEDAEVDWRVVRTFDNPLSAQMTLDFLRAHDIRVETRGNSPDVAVLNRFTSVVDIRLVVPANQLEDALQVLAAMTNGEPTLPAVEESPGAPAVEPAARSRRNPIAGAALALILPLGAGHFYARHNAAGTMMAAGIVGGVLGTLLGGPVELTLAAGFIVIIDAMLAPAAVRRTNVGRIPGDVRQRVFSFAVVATCYVLAIALGVYRARSSREPVNEAWFPAGSLDCSGEPQVGSCSVQCDKGNVSSCVALARLHLERSGADTDPARAIAPLTRACNVGFMEACTMLGDAYAHGTGVLADDLKALHFYTVACDARWGNGCMGMAYFFLNGKGVTKDDSKAAEAFARACSAGAHQGCEERARLALPAK